MISLQVEKVVNIHKTKNCSFTEQIHSYSTRASSSLNNYISLAETTSHRSLVYVGSEIWMGVPEELKFLNFHFVNTRLKNYFILLY